MLLWMMLMKYLCWASMNRSALEKGCWRLSSPGNLMSSCVDFRDVHMWTKKWRRMQPLLNSNLRLQGGVSLARMSLLLRGYWIADNEPPDLIIRWNKILEIIQYGVLVSRWKAVFIKF
ncbi:hypothetical protein ACOSQ4_020332 [Xanthoceras sorbifolium]